MSKQYLPDGALNLTGWIANTGGAGAGPEDDGTYIIPRGNQTITGNMADLTSTNGIGYLHTEKAFIGVVGTEAAPFTPKYNATTSASKASPGLVLGGPCSVYFAPVTNACGRARVYAGGQLHVVGSPTLTTTELRPGAALIVHTTGAVLTNVVNVGGQHTDLLDRAADYTDYKAIGAAVARLRAQSTLLTTKATPNGLPAVYVNHTDGVVAVVIDGGLIIPIRGDIPTITQYSGGFDLSQAENPMSLGASAWTRYPDAMPTLVQPGSPVTLGTIQDECGGIVNAFAPPGGIG